MAAAVAGAFEHLPGTGRGGKPIRVPARVTLGELTVNNVGTLRKLNQVLFPVAYSDKFYKDVLDPEISPEDYSKLIFYQDLAVGNIVCRLEPASSPLPTNISTSISPTLPPAPSTSAAAPKAAAKAPAEPQKLYIMTLGVLRPYRRQGLASKMLQQIIETAEASHRPPKEEPVVAKKAVVVAPKDMKAADSKPKAKAAPKPVISSLYLHVQVSNDEARRFWEKNGFKVVGTVENYYRKIEPRNAWVLERVVGGE